MHNILLYICFIHYHHVYVSIKRRLLKILIYIIFVSYVHNAVFNACHNVCLYICYATQFSRQHQCFAFVTPPTDSHSEMHRWNCKTRGEAVRCKEDEEGEVGGEMLRSQWEDGMLFREEGLEEEKRRRRRRERADFIDITV